jgi:hypothetical protein
MQVGGEAASTSKLEEVEGVGRSIEGWKGERCVAGWRRRVTGLRRTLPFSLIQAVHLPGQTSELEGAVPMIFCMTTQGLGSGLEMS